MSKLIPKARIVSFATWRETHASEAIALFQRADDERYYLTDADLAALQGLSFSDEGLEIARVLRDRASDIVKEL